MFIKGMVTLDLSSGRDNMVVSDFQRQETQQLCS